MKLIFKPAGLRHSARQADLDQWSDELLAQVDDQIEAWSRIHKKLALNNKMLGTSGMNRYSQEEREQLEILVRNMREFSSLVGGHHGEKVSRLYRVMRRVLADYDDFCDGERRAAPVSTFSSGTVQ